MHKGIDFSHTFEVSDQRETPNDKIYTILANCLYNDILWLRIDDNQKILWLNCHEKNLDQELKIIFSVCRLLLY